MPRAMGFLPEFEEKLLEWSELSILLSLTFLPDFDSSSADACDLGEDDADLRGSMT